MDEEERKIRDKEVAANKSEIDLEKFEPEYTKEELAGFESRAEKFETARQLMNKLGIKYGYTESDAVTITQLYDMFTDKQKLDELLRKLNLKAFW